MPRLKFDLKPRSREGGWQTREEHEAWVREVYAKHYQGEEPTPCDCGYWGDGWLTLCGANEREWCKATVAQRLEEHYRREHKEALAEKRKFPGLPFNVPYGTCSWCGQPIVHGRVKQRGMHDGRQDEPRCKQDYLLHIDLGVQQAHLMRRDGLGCVTCGKIEGRWQCWAHLDDDRLKRWSTENPKRWSPELFGGAASMVSWETGLEVDHFIALAVAYECFPEPDRRRWFFSPRNLRLLCHDCHAAKTQQDRALLRDIYAQGPEHGKAVVIGLLKDAGLLKAPA